MPASQQLIFVGGAPSVGKSATCDLLYPRLPDSIYLDADDLWCKMNPWRVNDSTRTMIEESITAVLRRYLRAGIHYPILCWVLHTQELIDRLVGTLGDMDFSFRSFTLVCEDEELRRRWASGNRSQGSADHACLRLSQTRLLTNTCVVDTTNLSPDGAADAIVEQLGAAQ